MGHYVPILVSTVVCVLVVVGLLIVGRLLRHRNSSLTNREPYECGNEPDSFAHDHRFSVRYYMIAVLFVVFDVETDLPVPLGGHVRPSSLLFGFIEMVVFLVILMVGYVYIWNRGALDWA